MELMKQETEQPKIEAMSFEQALEELKAIVSRLEGGEGTLDGAIEAFARGDALRRHCEAKLREAQEKIEKISRGSDGSVRTEPFDAT